jgi:hypothetical protein
VSSCLGHSVNFRYQAISLKSPQGRQMSVIEIFRQTAPERRMCHAGPVVLLGTRAWVERKVVGKK